MLRRWVAVALLVVAAASGASAQPLEAVDRLFAWVRELGGTIKAEVKTNEHGVRGIFATEHVKEGGYISSVPAACIINVGGLSESFAVPTLNMLRELKNPHSRFRPYLDVFPSDVLNSCNMDRKYLPLWKSEYWEKNVNEWQDYLERLHTGSLNQDLELTIEEAVGNATVTLDDLKYACAISSSRYVSASRRKRLLMAPIFDMANHKRDCEHSISEYDTSDFLHVVAGKDVQPGDELCYSYGSLRDDYSVAHYGFLPALEHPPRLCLVDHRDFKPDEAYSHDEAPSEAPYTGTPEELGVELARLQAIYSKLKATPDLVPPQPKGQDYTYDLLKELEARRLAALEYEIQRISGLLNDKSEL